MFKKNHHHGSAVSYHHLQIPLTSHVDELPEKLRKRLDTSWAGVFYPEFFCRLPALPSPFPAVCHLGGLPGRWKPICLSSLRTPLRSRA